METRLLVHHHWNKKWKLREKQKRDYKKYDGQYDAKDKKNSKGNEGIEVKMMGDKCYEACISKITKYSYRILILNIGTRTILVNTLFLLIILFWEKLMIFLYNNILLFKFWCWCNGHNLLFLM